MGYTVYYGNADAIAKAGFGTVAHLPCILDNRPGYHRTSSRYLIDRGLGIWLQIVSGQTSRIVRPTDQTMRNYAHWLANFLEWVEVRGIDLSTCNYADHIHGRYQDEMLNGTWSCNGVPLSPRTVNLRVQQACDFLMWMAAKGYREPFELPVKTTKVKAAGAIGHQKKEVTGRVGKVRESKRRLRIPTDDEVKLWLSRVYEKFGYAKGLMCETVLLTAVRREEAACWRVSTLPGDPELWHITNCEAPSKRQGVLVSIKFGAKGPCHGYDHGDKVGPERFIRVPLGLAVRLQEYRDKSRNRALKRWVKAAPTLAAQMNRIKDAVHLFLNEETGQRITGKELYNAWTGVALPFKGWAPHLGRDWWACSTLWLELKRLEHLRTLGVDATAAGIKSSAMSAIQFHIQPQLGHAHDSTTMIYLQWLEDMLDISLPSLDDEVEHYDSSERRLQRLGE